jgi:hypothetical protein
LEARSHGPHVRPPAKALGRILSTPPSRRSRPQAIEKLQNSSRTPLGPRRSLLAPQSATGIFEVYGCHAIWRTVLYNDSYESSKFKFSAQSCSDSRTEWPPLPENTQSLALQYGGKRSISVRKAKNEMCSASRSWPYLSPCRKFCLEPNEL